MESIFPTEGGEGGTVGEQAEHEGAREIAQEQGQGWIGGVGTVTPPWDIKAVQVLPTAPARPKFDPREHMMKMRGKDYLEVRYRLYWLRLDHPEAIIETECIEYTNAEATFRARIAIPGGGVATGHKTVKKGEFAKFYEKSETGAIGRALAHLGYGTLEGGEDVDEGADEGGIVDTPSKPVRPQAQAPATPARQEATKANNKDGLGFSPVTYEGKKIANMTQMQKAIYAAPGHDERQDLYDLAKAAGWGKPALTVIREDWDGANRADEIATVAE